MSGRVWVRIDGSDALVFTDSPPQVWFRARPEDPWDSNTFDGEHLAEVPAPVVEDVAEWIQGRRTDLTASAFRAEFGGWGHE